MQRSRSNKRTKPTPTLTTTPTATDIHYCAQFGDVLALQKLLQDNPGLLNETNQNGETPLHVATKHGCNDVARVLLAHGTFVEGKTNNGMTPLHFSVRYSHRSEECATFKTLLEYDADSSVTDDELKEQLQIWAKGVLLDERRRALGIEVGPEDFLHMAFLGNPGTGKTMIARTLGKLLHMIGILPTDKVIEVQRTDLVDERMGHTGLKTRRKIKEAEGGILFVDEAHQLIPMQKSDDIDFGLEALEEIMSVMENGELAVIFAGHCKPMQHLISSKEGFYRRITSFFCFNDFSPEELAKILHIKMVKQTKDSPLYGFKLHPACTIEAISDLIKRETQEKQRNQMNGRLIDQMLVNARVNLNGRLRFACDDTEELCTITMDDLEAGVQNSNASLMQS